MKFWSEVSSCASRPIEAIVWIREVEPAKSSTDLKTSSVTGTKLQTNFEALDSKIASSLKSSINQNLKRRVLIQEEAVPKKHTF